MTQDSRNMMYLSRLVIGIEPGDPAQDPNGFLCPVFLLQHLGLPAQQIKLIFLEDTGIVDTGGAP
jgi:hypothetical protein